MLSLLEDNKLTYFRIRTSHHHIVHLFNCDHRENCTSSIDFIKCTTSMFQVIMTSKYLSM